MLTQPSWLRAYSTWFSRTFWLLCALHFHESEAVTYSLLTVHRQLHLSCGHIPLKWQLLELWRFCIVIELLHWCHVMYVNHQSNVFSATVGVSIFHLSPFPCVTSLFCLHSSSVLWHCWLGVRKSIRSVKNWVMRCWRGCLSGARWKWFVYGQADATATPSSLSSLQSRMGFLSAGLPSLSWKIGH